MTPVQPSASETMRTQISRGLGIPRELYLSEALFEQEADAVFTGSWQLAGHQSQLEKPGQYVTVESGPDSIVVARSADGTLAAFHNVCRHRGARLVDPGCGSARRLVCPYHQWTYRMDGTLQGAPRMQPGFDPARYPLPRAHVATWQGLVFVSLADDPGAPPEELLGPGTDLIAPFDLPGARVAHSITYQVRANWKLVWENAQECYHCNANHPELLKALDVAGTTGEEEYPAGAYRSQDRRVQCTPFQLKVGALSLTTDGWPASAKPMGDFAHGREPYTAAIHLKPTFAAVCSPDYAVLLRDRPLAVDRTEVTMHWLVRADAVAGVDYDLDNLVKVWDSTNLQDWALCERTQLGVQSRSFRPGPLSGDEPSVAGFHYAYAEMLAAAGL